MDSFTLAQARKIADDLRYILGTQRAGDATKIPLVIDLLVVCPSDWELFNKNANDIYHERPKGIINLVDRSFNDYTVVGVAYHEIVLFTIPLRDFKNYGINFNPDDYRG